MKRTGIYARVSTKDQNTEEMDEKELRKFNRIVFTACGTSWHAALIGEYMIEQFVKIPCEVEYAAEFRYRHPVVDEILW